VCTDDLTTICQQNRLSELAEKYILACREDVDSKKHSRFPNIAGFCRFFGFSADSLEKIKSEYPNSYSALCLIFEDEALNSDVSASVLSAYLKKRLGYGDEKEKTDSSLELDKLKLVFEHDIVTDGE
jgi:hypothetical protein